MATLGVNIDHVATIREARRTIEPDPVWAAAAAELGGADAITIHLREDRRHIQDRDLEVLRKTVQVKLNLELAMNPLMVDVACRAVPDQVTLVPENREEVTTEGGLDVVCDQDRLGDFIAPLAQAGCRVSLFVAADEGQLQASAQVGAAVVELHTGAYCDFHAEGNHQAAKEELARITRCAQFAADLGLEVHAGHGLSYETVAPIAALPEVAELNIGHFLIGESVFLGLGPAIAEMRRLMQNARR